MVFKEDVLSNNISIESQLVCGASVLADQGNKFSLCFTNSETAVPFSPEQMSYAEPTLIVLKSKDVISDFKFKDNGNSYTLTLDLSREQYNKLSGLKGIPGAIYGFVDAHYPIFYPGPSSSSAILSDESFTTLTNICNKLGVFTKEQLSLIIGSEYHVPEFLEAVNVQHYASVSTCVNAGETQARTSAQAEQHAV